MVLVALAFFASGLLVPLAAQAQDPIEYYAAVDRNEIAVDETLTLTVTLTMRGKEPTEFQLPTTSDFDVISQGTSTQSSFSFGTGGASSTRTRTHTMVLRPLREGRLAIEPGVAVLDGKRYQTGKITVQVGKAGTGRPQAQQPLPRRPSTPFGGFPGFDEDPFGRRRNAPPPTEGDVVLVASVDKEEVYIGEQVTLSISLRSRREVGGIPNFQMPKFDGFWAEDLESPTQIEAETQVIDGIAWRVYHLRRRALFPLREGELQIDPAQVEVEMGGSFFARRDRLSRSSRPVTLRVKPLPPGAPRGFAPSNVGRWELHLDAEPTTAAFGAPITLLLRAEGVGNLGSLELPRLPAIEGMKIFDPVQHDEVQIRQRRYGGSRVHEYVLVPQRAGRFTIPAVEMPFFHPQTGRYETGRTQPISLQVLPGQMPQPQGQPQGQGRVAGGDAPPPVVADPGSGLAGIRAATSVEPRARPIYRSSWFAFALLLPGLALLGAVLMPRISAAHARGEDGRRKKGAGRVARKRLAAARALAGRGEGAFYTELDRALHAYLELKLGRPTAGLAREQLAEILQEAGVPQDARDALRETLDTCDVGRFAPGALAAGAAATALERAAAVIDGIEASALGGAR